MNVKRILATTLAIFALAITSVDAQPGGGGGGGMGGGMGGGPGGMGGGREGGMGGERPDMASIDLVMSSGLFMLNSSKAIKSLKLKDKELEKQAAELLKNYQTTYDNLTVEYSEQIKTIRAVSEKMSELRESGNTDQLRAQMTTMRSSMEELRPKAREMHKVLSDGMKAILDEDTLKRWTKYYTLICEDYNFSLEERKRPQRGEGGQGGQGGQGGGRPQ